MWIPCDQGIHATPRSQELRAADNRSAHSGLDRRDLRNPGDRFVWLALLSQLLIFHHGYLFQHRIVIVVNVMDAQIEKLVEAQA